MYDKKISARTVTLTDSKETVLGIFHRVIKNRFSVAIPDLTTGVRQNVSDLYKNLQRHGETGKFIASQLPFGDDQALEECRGQLDATAVQFFESYCLRWDDALRADGLHPKDISADTINSSRILIAELFKRMFLQVLREDSQLPTMLTRYVWVDCMADFTTELLDTQYHDLSLDEDFKPILIKMLMTWMPTVQQIGARIEDIAKAESVIKHNLTTLNAMRIHVMRCIVMQLITKNKANQVTRPAESMHSKLDDTSEKLVEVEQQWIKNQTKLTVSGCSKIVRIISGDSKADIGALNLSYRELDFIALKLVAETTILRQQTIFENHPSPLTRDLYSLLHWITVLGSLMDKLFSLIDMGGWVPRLMEGLKLTCLDKELICLKNVFNQLIDLKHMKHLEGTIQYNEILKPTATMVAAKLQKMQSFGQLQNQNKFLSLWARAQLVEYISHIHDFGRLVGCEIIDVKLCQDVINSLDSGSSSTASSSEFQALTPSSPQITAHQSHQVARRVEQATLSTPYIILFQDQMGISDTLSELYYRFIHRMLLGFLNKFDDDDFFSQAQTLVKETRTLIQEFERNKMEPSEPHSAVDVWKQRREEIFVLKYLCVTSVEDKNNLLYQFIDRMIENAYRAVLNFPAVKYNELPIKLEALLKQSKTDRRFQYPNASASADHYLAESILMEQNAKQALTISNQAGEISQYKRDLEALTGKLSETQQVFDQQSKIFGAEPQKFKAGDGQLKQNQLTISPQLGKSMFPQPFESVSSNISSSSARLEPPSPH